MRASRIYLLLLVLFALPVTAQKVYVDYDNATAFSEYTTYAYRETPHDLRRVSPSLHDDVVAKLTGYAEEGGLTSTDSDPDLYMAYYAAYYGELRLALGDLMYSYGEGFVPGAYWDGGVGTRDVTKKSFRFKEGTVIVDVWDRERGILVWRGMVTAALKKDYLKNEAKLDKALDKLMKKWEAEYGGQARAIRKMKAEKKSGGG